MPINTFPILSPCPKCNETVEIVINVFLPGAAELKVKCNNCGIESKTDTIYECLGGNGKHMAPLSRETIAKGKRALINKWNRGEINGKRERTVQRES